MDEQSERLMISLPVSEARHLIAAEGYIELGMFEEADEELEQVSPPLRMTPQALVLKLCVYAGLKHWDLVQTIAEKMAVHEPHDAQWSIWSASAACRSESIEAARSILLEALQRHPDNAYIHYNLSCYESRLGDFKRAERHLARAIQLDPQFKLMAMTEEDLEWIWIKPDPQL